MAWMCLGPRTGVLSVGIGGDISFDLALVRRFGASVRCFDPTISEDDFERLLGNASATAEERARVRFYPFGLAARNSVIPFYRSTNPIVHSLVSEPGLRGYAPAAYLRAPTLRLPQLLSVAGLERVDVLKADIEGAEWSVFNRSDVEVALAGSRALESTTARRRRRAPARRARLHEAIEKRRDKRGPDDSSARFISVPENVPRALRLEVVPLDREAGAAGEDDINVEFGRRRGAGWAYDESARADTAPARSTRRPLAVRSEDTAAIILGASMKFGHGAAARRRRRRRQPPLHRRRRVDHLGTLEPVRLCGLAQLRTERQQRRATRRHARHSSCAPRAPRRGGRRRCCGCETSAASCSRRPAALFVRRDRRRRRRRVHRQPAQYRRGRGHSAGGWLWTSVGHRAASLRWRPRAASPATAHVPWRRELGGDRHAPHTSRRSRPAWRSRRPASTAAALAAGASSSSSSSARPTAYDFASSRPRRPR